MKFDKETSKVVNNPPHTPCTWRTSTQAWAWEEWIKPKRKLR